jgi:hypothetical protein
LETVPFRTVVALGFWQPTRRILSAFVLLNIVPWMMCAWVLFLLRNEPPDLKTWTLGTACVLIFGAMFPGLIPFGCYRLWLAIVQMQPAYFYAEKQDQVPEKFRYENKSNSENNKIDGIGRIEPDMEWLDKHLTGASMNMWFAAFYIVIPLLFACMLHS